MIKIKNNIFNENRIVQMCINERNNLEIDTDNGFPIVIKDATFEDIEWNYGGQVSGQVSGQVKDEEIIYKEDKKITKIGRKARNLTNQYLKDKINEIIDKINGGGE